LEQTAQMALMEPAEETQALDSLELLAAFWVMEGQRQREMEVFRREQHQMAVQMVVTVAAQGMRQRQVLEYISVVVAAEVV
jgi:hypothetical protein